MKIFYVNFVSMWIGSVLKSRLKILSVRLVLAHPHVVFLAHRRRRLGSVTELPLTYNFHLYNLISSPTHKSLCVSVLSSPFRLLLRCCVSHSLRRWCSEVSCFLSIFSFSDLLFFSRFYFILCCSIQTERWCFEQIFKRFIMAHLGENTRRKTPRAHEEGAHKTRRKAYKFIYWTPKMTRAQALLVPRPTEESSAESLSVNRVCNKNQRLEVNVFKL